LNVDHTVTYDIVLSIVFQLVRIILQTTFSFNFVTSLNIFLQKHI